MGYFTSTSKKFSPSKGAEDLFAVQVAHGLEACSRNKTLSLKPFCRKWPFPPEGAETLFLGRVNTGVFTASNRFQR